MMRPLRAFLLSFAAGLTTLVAGQFAVAGLVQPEPEPVLRGPLVVPIA